MPRISLNGRLMGTIKCRECATTFSAHCSQRFCNEICRKAYNKKHGKPPRKEDQNTKRIRRLRYRADNLKKGMCKHCSRIIFRGGRCHYHFLQNKALDRIRKAKKNYGEHWQKHVLLLTIRDQIEEIDYESEQIIRQNG